MRFPWFVSLQRSDRRSRDRVHASIPFIVALPLRDQLEELDSGTETLDPVTAENRRLNVFTELEGF